MQTPLSCAIRKLFPNDKLILSYRTCKLTFGVLIAYRKYGLLHNNNPVERYNGKLDDRLKVGVGQNSLKIQTE